MRDQFGVFRVDASAHSAKMIEFRAFPVECCGNRTNKLLVVVAVRGARLPFVLDLAVPPLVYAKIPGKKLS